MIDIATVPEELQDELLDLRNDSAGREMFLEMVKKDNFNDFFSDETWLQGLAYLADITT